MKYIKKYENNEHRLGLYADIKDILYIIKYLQEKNVRFTTLYGTDDEEEYDKCFLILIEGNSYNNLPFIIDVDDDADSTFKDFYIKKEDKTTTYLNWFNLDEVNDGIWEIMPNLDDLEMFVTLKKYNL